VSKRICVLAVLLGAVSACSRGDAADAASVVRDSAGVAIVESARAAWEEGEGWTVAAEPELEIGVVEGAAAYQLDQVSGALRLSDGRVVVADAGAGEVRWFGADGRHLLTAGRKGDGPGEFQGIGRVDLLAGDSVAVWDARAVRLTVFGPDGKLARTVTPEGVRGMGTQMFGVLADGSFVVSQGIDLTRMVEQPEGEGRAEVEYLRIAADGKPAGRVARAPGRETYLLRLDGNSATHNVVFGREHVALAAGDAFFAGDNGAFSITRHRADGAAARVLRRAHQPVAVAPDDVERYHEAQGEASYQGMPPEMEAFLRESTRRAREKVPTRETFPAFRAMRMDADGNLWVEEYRRPGDQQPRWSVFDAEGRWLGTVETPAGLAVHQIGRDWMVGSMKDELDVQHVRLYRIEKPAK
jgi:hypothetical protein